MEATDLNEARIYVGTYAKYNNGSLQGEWVELSDFYDLDGFMERCAGIHEDEEAPEYMFQAWEEIPDCLIDEWHLEENFFELRDELDRLNDTEKEAFWVWADGNNIQLTQDAYSLVKAFQSAYMGSYASREDFAEEIVKMENDLSDFALNYFDFSKYADDLFDMDFWYKDGYVFRNNWLRRTDYETEKQVRESSTCREQAPATDNQDTEQMGIPWVYRPFRLPTAQRSHNVYELWT